MLKDSLLHPPRVFMCNNFIIVNNLEHLEPPIYCSNSLNNLKNFFTSSFGSYLTWLEDPISPRLPWKNLDFGKQFVIHYDILSSLSSLSPPSSKKFFIILTFFPLRLYVRLRFSHPFSMMISKSITLHNTNAIRWSCIMFLIAKEELQHLTYGHLIVSLPPILLKAYLMNFSTPTS